MEGSGSQKQTPNTGTYDPVTLETEVAERWTKENTFENSINKSFKPEMQLHKSNKSIIFI